MQRSTGKELALRAGELRDLLKEAVDHHKHTMAARSSVENGQQLALFHAWQAGVRLNKMKELVGHGNWEKWVESNFCDPNDLTIRMAQIYMKIDNDNAELRRIRAPKTKHVSFLKFDTVRKHAIGFVPDKEQPEHSGNAKFPRLSSFVNIGNEYEKLRYRHTEGLQLVDFDEAREETKDIYQFLRWLHGDEKKNPWQKE
jgi:hypothetical protein